jgi:hypothetical protein
MPDGFRYRCEFKQGRCHGREPMRGSLESISGSSRKRIGGNRATRTSRPGRHGLVVGGGSESAGAEIAPRRFLPAADSC